MNNNTREDLKAFIEAVENLADTVSPESYESGYIYRTAEQLKSQLDKDETILP